jgi:seryl-tRNA(Sec) selenium transferase
MDSSSTQVRFSRASQLPSVDRALGFASVRAHVERYGRTAVIAELRGMLETARAALRAGKAASDDWSADALGERAMVALEPCASRIGSGALPVPVIGRISEGAFRLDLRCLEDEAAFVAQLARLEA